jgi:hypothetical protein
MLRPIDWPDLRLPPINLHNAPRLANTSQAATALRLSPGTPPQPSAGTGNSPTGQP